MIDLGAPWWLLALAALPLIRWLHRFSAPLVRLRVNALFLWRTAATPPGRSPVRQPPDPAWRRRALITALLTLTLTDPAWHTTTLPVTVWVDDSLSMTALEHDSTRLAAALQKIGTPTEIESMGTLTKSGKSIGTPTILPEPEFGTPTVLGLRDLDPRTTVFRSLSDPSTTRPADATAFEPATWLSAQPRSPSPPPPSFMSPDRMHWLLTDGADAEVVRWAASASLSRIVTVGDATENVAVTRLAVRRSPDGDIPMDVLIKDGPDGDEETMDVPIVRPDGENEMVDVPIGEMVDVLIEVANRGLGRARRELVVRSGEVELEAQGLDLGAGEVRSLHTRHTVGEAGLVAELSPGDPVVLDDRLELSAEAFAKVPVLIDESCPAALQLAIDAHPALSRSAADDGAALHVLCSDVPTAAPASLRIHNGPARPLGSPPQWLPSAGRLQDLRLATEWLSASDWGAAQLEGAEPLLTSGNAPLLVRGRTRPQHLATVIDLAYPLFSRQPEYPALIGGLLDLALDRQLLDAVFVTARLPRDSDIAPSTPLTRTPQAGAASKGQRSLAAVPLLLAVLLLIFDLFCVMRGQWTARHA